MKQHGECQQPISCSAAGACRWLPSPAAAHHVVRAPSAEGCSSSLPCGGGPCTKASVLVLQRWVTAVAGVSATPPAGRASTWCARQCHASVPRRQHSLCRWLKPHTSECCQGQTCRPALPRHEVGQLPPGRVTCAEAPCLLCACRHSEGAGWGA